MTNTIATLTKNPIARALLVAVPTLFEQIVEQRTASFVGCATKYAVPSVPGYWTTPHVENWREREYVNAVCREAAEISTDFKSAYLMADERGGSHAAHCTLRSSTIDAEKLHKIAQEQAHATALAWFRKIESKIGACVAATLTRMCGNQYALDCTLADGRVVQIKQQVVHGISSTGTRYVQFPARLYINGKFITEAAYKQLVAC